MSDAIRMEVYLAWACKYWETKPSMSAQSPGSHYAIIRAKVFGAQYVTNAPTNHTAGVGMTPLTPEVSPTLGPMLGFYDPQRTYLLRLSRPHFSHPPRLSRTHARGACGKGVVVKKFWTASVGITQGFKAFSERLRILLIFVLTLSVSSVGVIPLKHPRIQTSAFRFFGQSPKAGEIRSSKWQSSPLHTAPHGNTIARKRRVQHRGTFRCMRKVGHSGREPTSCYLEVHVRRSGKSLFFISLKASCCHGT